MKISCLGEKRRVTNVKSTLSQVPQMQTPRVGGILHLGCYCHSYWGTEICVQKGGKAPFPLKEGGKRQKSPCCLNVEKEKVVPYCQLNEVGGDPLFTSIAKNWK